MKTLTVELGQRSYPIAIAPHLLQQRAWVTPYVRAQQVCIVTNDTVAPLYLAQTRALFAQFNCSEVILPDGEAYKTLETLNLIFDHLLQQRCDRQVTLVALGGGVIGDTTGFAAACYQRGVPFIQIPTTLLSQVDSSVGGKTGVNHALGKNMIGAFYQPQCVLIDINTLNTLPDQELSAGFAEVVKYGLINDLAFFEWLEQHAEALIKRDPDRLIEAIAHCCQNKADIVAADEQESGLRALLNLGHTFGHAIETGVGYGVCLHGEAVAIGMVLAAKLSARHGWLSADDVQRIIRLLKRFHLPVTLPKTLTAQQIYELMQVDKKVKAGQLRLVLLSALGQAIITKDYDPHYLQLTLEEGCAEAMSA
ncbi:3-dehydroquinate synthase [Thioflexithrix psekupsensis]|uniref:3-dehydroquinate synthase n=1 Tax=Thioflexithrix psekupsensis TaxID=1570016 RepID=A0A251X505_9GAMM|nr:3-dehydroquinate synthase [Thioflexithrix psekupsensis]OUD12470.1 3-dehydroquinate synthase [Thioflexithrix psekupsensis]